MSSTVTQPWPNPRQLLAGKVAVITGSSRGIGRAIALAYAYEGAAIVCADLSAATHPRAGAEFHHMLDDVAGQETGADVLPTDETIQKIGGKALFVEADVCVEKSMEALVVKTVAWAEEIGLGRRLDIFVNNAGVAIEAGNPRPIWEIDVEQTWEPTMRTNATSVMLGTKYAAKQMISQEPSQSGDRGSIVNIASAFGLTCAANQIGYNSSKHAAVAITKTAALDLAPHRVHVNAICPGYAPTRLLDAALVGNEASRAYLDSKHPFRGLGMPSDFTGLAVYLASDANTWMTGATVSVDGGFTAG